MPVTPTWVGTDTADQAVGAPSPNVMLGLAGNDSLSGAGSDDLLIGDYAAQNLLDVPEGATGFSHYAAAGWQVSETADGHQQMTQSVNTLAGASYTLSFEAAANYGAGVVSGRIAVFWNGESIGIVDVASGIFEDISLSFTGTGGAGALTFVSLEGAQSGPAINTDGPVFWYEKEVELGGESQTVKAFAEGQGNIYQVMNGQLNVFDPVSETYTPAGAPATVNINCIGFNQEDDLIYGIAVGKGVDALGHAVDRADLVMIDAEGHAYRVGETPYRSWTGDFDESGNLWVFHSSMDRVTMVDVDSFDANGDPLSTTFKFPKSMISQSVWDVAYDAASQTFYGIVKPSSEGGQATLMQIDISEVAAGGLPIFSTIPVVSTEIDGAVQTGVPAITFGAFVIDGDGNFYAGGNGGDHDMNDATRTAGGIYRVETNDDGTEARLVLVSDAPKAFSNDGAVDPRALDPFTPIDATAGILIRGPELTPTPQASSSFDDVLIGGGGQDSAIGGFGADEVIGGGRGDSLEGNGGDDALYGGAGPDALSSVLSIYDDDGLRFDQFGTLLPEDDDILMGGAGADLLHGSAGHDTLMGGSGDDTLEAGSGFDVLFGGMGDDHLSGGANRDTLDGGAGEDQLAGGSGEDHLAGGLGHDRLNGGSGADVLVGDDGNDTLDGSSGNDTLDGGAGNDSLKGGSGDDALTGGDGDDRLTGYKGDDVLDGGAGKDTLYLGAGADIATGGAGSDRFVFRLDDLDGRTDRITDFARDSLGRDRLDLRQLDLLADISEADWIAAFLSQTEDGGVRLALEASTVLFDSRGDDGADLLADIVDGLVF